MTEPVASPVETIIIVHGTFANGPNDSGILRWWEPGSDFCLALDEALKSRGLPARTWVHVSGQYQKALTPLHEIRFMGVTINDGKRTGPKSTAGLFSWSGANSELQRRVASNELSEELKRLEKDPNIGCWHLIGHSHGGNVIRRALRDIPDIAKGGFCVMLGTPLFPFGDEGYLRNLVRCINWPILICLLIVIGGFGEYVRYLFKAGLNPGPGGVMLIVAFMGIITGLSAALGAYFRVAWSPLRHAPAVNITFPSDEAIGLLKKCARIATDTHIFLHQMLSSAGDEQGTKELLISRISRWPLIGSFMEPLGVLTLLLFSHPYRPTFRMFFSSRLVSFKRRATFISEYEDTSIAQDPDLYVQTGTMIARVATWMTYALFLPFDIVLGCGDWFLQIASRFSIWLGLKMAAKTVFGIDVLGSSFQMDLVGRPVENIQEHQISAKVEAAVLDRVSRRDHIRKNFAEVLRVEEIGLLAKAVRTSLQDVNLLHAQYYQEQFIIELIADYFKSGTATETSSLSSPTG